MLGGGARLLPWLAIAISASFATDMVDELAGEWKMGLRPRQAATDLQTFDGALGGVSAAAVCSVLFSRIFFS